MQIWWIRRDLRLEDNPALTAAMQSGAGVLPVFVLDEYLLSRKAEKRQAFLFSALRDLEVSLIRLGSGLVVRKGNPVVEIPALAAECGAEAVFAEEDVSPYAVCRDAAVARQVELRLVHGLGVHPAGAVTRPDGGAYTVFTPYSRTWKALPFSEKGLAAPFELNPIPNLPSMPLPDLPAPEGFPATLDEARRRLESFLEEGVFRYADGRNRLDIKGTSALSPYLRFGMLSARRVAAAARQGGRQAADSQSRAGCEAFLNELIWREFYQAILYHFPQVLTTAFNPARRAVQWRDSLEDLHAWQAGNTGYPVVDAAMRQLAVTGWMHNRARMITASFLTKDLLIDWRAGERWFMQMLVDGEAAANNGGWQWTAGTGADAAPYFRVFNPVLQGKKFDPEGKYVRRWLPELAQVPQEYIHAPWEMPVAGQHSCGVIIGRDYPGPLVDHAEARRRALAAYSPG